MHTDRSTQMRAGYSVRFENPLAVIALADRASAGVVSIGLGLVLQGAGLVALPIR